MRITKKKIKEYLEEYYENNKGQFKIKIICSCGCDISEVINIIDY